MIALSNTAFSHAWLGHRAEAIAALDEHERRFQSNHGRGAPHRSVILALLGDADGARRAVGTAIATAANGSDVRLHLNQVLALAVLRCRAGDADVALTYLTALEGLPTLGPSYVALRRRFRATAAAALAPGDDADAMAAGHGLSVDDILHREVRPGTDGSS